MSPEKICSEPNKDLTPATKFMASLEILVDKMHMAGHTDKWCKDTCDSRKVSDLNEVRLVYYHKL